MKTTLRGRPLPLTLALAASLLGVLGAGSGCNTNDHRVNTVEPANPAYVRRHIEDRRIVRDATTAQAVAILGVIDGSTPDGLVRIGVEVQNQRSTTFRFNYRFDWFDSQGLPVSTPATTMVSQQIEGGQVLTLTSVAPQPGAKDFRLSIQKSTRSRYPLLPKN